MDQKAIKLKLYKELPLTIKNLLLNSSGFLVGGAIDKLVLGEEPKDYDIIIPDRESFMSAVRFLHTSMVLEPNTFGGMKFTSLDKDQSLVIDIWCEELSHFMVTATKMNFIYNMKRSLLIQIF